MIVEQPGFWLAVLQIIRIDILLSGDNAVVIALACRKLPSRQRVWGVVLGTLVAISLRVVFAGLVTTLMKIAYLKLVGGVLLLWIAVKLLGPEENSKNGEVEPVDNLWRAVRIIAKDPLFTANLDTATAHTVWIIGATLGALFVVGAGMVRRRWLRRSAPDQI